MVEILCISAEITVGLLIIAVLWDRSASTQRLSNHHSEASSSSNGGSHCNTVRLFDQCLHLVNRLEKKDHDSTWFKAHASLMSAALEDLQGSALPAHVDRLTGLWSDPFLREALEECWGDQPSIVGALTFFDIDGLKDFNDANGMDFGDTLIRKVAEELSRAFNPVAYVARLEGGKFAVFFPSMSLANSSLISEQIRSQLSRQHYDVQGKSVSATLSASVIDLAVASECNDAFQMLDEGLLKAKSEGRNRSNYQEGNIWHSPVSLPATETPIESGPITPSEVEPLFAGTKGAQLPDTSNVESQAVEEEMASSNDIEALLAAARNTNKPDKPEAKPEEKKALEPKLDDNRSAAEPAEETTSKASGDEIEALLASMRGTPKPKTALVKDEGAELLAEVKTTTAEASKATQSPKEVDPTESASSDDIAALFASMKSKA